MNKKNYLSCDDINDAIESIALAYCVDSSVVRKIFDGDWPEFLSEHFPHNEFYKNPETLLYLMSHQMQIPEINKIDFDVAYYHRGRFDGTKAWYQNGLLASKPGINALFNNVRSYIPKEMFDDLLNLSINTVATQISYDGVSEGGPFGFQWFDQAFFADQTGSDFSLPEFLMDSIWHDINHKHKREILVNVFKKKLSQVIVKFIVHEDNCCRYLCGLWHYLWCKKNKFDLPDFCITYSGNGISIPENRILKLFPIQGEMQVVSQH